MNGKQANEYQQFRLLGAMWDKPTVGEMNGKQANEYCGSNQ